MRKLRWLLIAAVLFTLAALLMRSEEKDDKREISRAARAMDLPRHRRAADVQRARERATLFDLVETSEPGAAPLERRRDPFLTAMPPVEARETAIVLEANAIRYSALGERFIACIAGEQQKRLDELRDELGIDPLQDIDRIGVTDHLITISGNFENIHFEKLQNAEGRPYGNDGIIYESARDAHLGLWRHELILAADDAQQVEQAIDRLENRGPKSTPPISSDDAYGEIYGHLDPKTFLEVLPPESREKLRGKLEQAAQKIDLHASVQNDVGIVATVRGDDNDALVDLAKSLGGALAVGRVMARANGEDDLAEILDLARVARSFRGDSSSFDAELALPEALLEKHLAEVCERHAEEAPPAAAP